MEKSFDFGALLKNHEKKHKSKPLQFMSVAGGVQKRLEKNLKYRKSSRLSVFDSIRNLPRCESPLPLSDAQLKVEHRRQQLEKWKEEKEKKKKAAAAQKKKPFVAGVPHAPLKFVPPPPPKLMPSTSGRVTRSQSAKNSAKIKVKQTKSAVQSFAPKNASFRPPEIKSLTNLPCLTTAKVKKDKRLTHVIFEPILHHAPKEAEKQVRAKPLRQAVTETKAMQKTSERNAKNKTNNKIPNTSRGTRKQVETSSSNEIEENHLHILTKRNTRKAAEQSLPNISRKTPKKSMFIETSDSQTSSGENDLSQSPSDVTLVRKNSRISRGANSSPMINRKTLSKSLQKEVITSESSSEDNQPKSSTKVNSRASFAGYNSPMVTKKTPRKSLLKDPVTSTSSLDQSNSSPDLYLTKKIRRKSYVDTSPIISRKTQRTSLPHETSNSEKKSLKTPRKSLQNDVRTPKNMVPKSESSSEEKLRSPKSLNDEPRTPEQIIEEAKKCSPCVTMSRGKDNARKEMKKKLAEGLLDDDASNMDSIDHFRRQLASEIERITEMCETWDKISEQTVLPESVQETVLGAVGQARLLMAQKLQQFATLLERCARPEPGVALVTPADLHGFWDMVFMQVENIDMRFKYLEELRLRDWVELQPAEVKRKVVHKPNAKKPAKSAAATSRLREMIAAARKAKKQEPMGQGIEPQQPAPAGAGEPDSKTFEAGFFCVRSPVKSPSVPSTPARTNSLLKAVLSSEAKKASASKSSASFAMLRASVLGKNVECEGITLMPQTPKTPINLDATPGRSILKATNSTKKSSKKSIKLVLFDKNDVEIQEFSPDSSADQEIVIDSGLSSMDVERFEEKENTRCKPKLVRQDAEERSPVMTRSRRKSMTDEGTPKRSGKKVLQEFEDNVVEQMPVTRSSRRRKSGVEVQN